MPTRKTEYNFMSEIRSDWQEKIKNGECNSKTKVVFICSQCNSEYQQSLSEHKNSLCRKCSYENKARIQRGSKFPYVDDLRQDYKDKYNNKQLRMHDKAIFICPIHGEYQQSLIYHKKARDNGSNGCNECAKLNRHINMRKNDYDFINDLTKESKQLVLSKSVTNRDRVDFICSSCNNIYSQILGDHALHNNCPVCNLAKTPYSFLEFIRTLTNNIVINDRTVITPMEIDFYLPDYKIGIEFNDIKTHQTPFKEQILQPEWNTGKSCSYHIDKYRLAKKNGIRLIQIWDIEWQDKRIRPILESIIKNALGMNNTKIYARNCSLEVSTATECNKFFNENHIQGSARGNGYFSLTYNCEIVGAICYTKAIKLVNNSKRKANVTISRMAFKKEHTIVGGASRLLKAVIQTMQKDDIIEYLVLNDYFDGISFQKTGWEISNEYGMVRYYDKVNKHSYYRHPSKYKERKQRCIDGNMCRYYTSGTTTYTKINN